MLNSLLRTGRMWCGALFLAGALGACAHDDRREEALTPARDAARDQRVFAPAPIIDRSLPEIAQALRTGEVSSEAVTRAYLERIEAIDAAGPRLQSVLAINPNALDEARAADNLLKAGQALPPLHGVPILLKDNIETKDPIATTAGALALENNVTGRDAPLVEKLRQAGAVILGKTNLSQWANFRSNDSLSGWSTLGGQVRNPHILDRNPCGSSSGSGAAAAASLAAGAVGTETNGSIICPAHVNGIVGFKPTVGVVSQRHIVPISHSQDTAGPMAKTVRGAAMMLDAMAERAGPGVYAAGLDEASLAGARIGVMRFAAGDNSDIERIFDRALSDMKAAGAELVEIEEFAPNTEDFGDKAYAALLHEFKAGLNDYLAGSPADIPVRTLEQLIAFNEAEAGRELALFGQDIFEAAQEKGSLEEPDYRNARDDVQRATRAEGIDRLLADHEVDILVSPSGVLASAQDPINGDVWPQWAGGGYLAAIAGYPHASVPAGLVHGLPLGVSFIGARGDDARVLSFAYAYEQATERRREPQFLKTAEERPELGAAMPRRE